MVVLSRRVELPRRVRGSRAPGPTEKHVPIHLGRTDRHAERISTDDRVTDHGGIESSWSSGPGCATLEAVNGAQSRDV